MFHLCKLYSLCIAVIVLLAFPRGSDTKDGGIGFIRSVGKSAVSATKVALMNRNEKMIDAFRNMSHGGGGSGRPVNILIMLADDLGYGDTSVYPFTGMGVITPELEKMASRGTIMTNFHTAAATCTPTRASILTGLYPWRMGIKAVYEYGLKGKSNRDDWLPQIPTTAMVFKEAKYFTGHSGKWHIGGMRNDDLDMRLQDPRKEGFRGGRRCPHPGPNQQGFEEYVSVLDGPGAPRQNEYQVNDMLHSQGCNILLNNDRDIGGGKDANAKSGEFLSDCEARHAIRMMRNSVKAKKPFFIQLWFHAPHGPWEELPGFKDIYPDPPRPANHELPLCHQNRSSRYCALNHNGMQRQSMDRGPSIEQKYKTMVTAMDRSIGKVLREIKTLGIEKDTLVVFLSDNGPEDVVGQTAGFRGNKRFLYEGGIRVPAIFQWVGTIPKGRNISTFGVSTDLFPTFLDATGVKPPSNLRLDGMSLLPELIGRGKHHLGKRRKLKERVTLWHGEYEGPRATVAWLFDFKVMFNASDFPTQMWDMRVDQFEQRNLLQPFENMTLQEIFSWDADYHLDVRGRGSLRREKIKSKNTPPVFTLNDMNDPVKRTDRNLHRYIVIRTYQTMIDFALHGDEAHKMYLSANPGRNYTPSVESDQRYIRGNPYKFISQKESKEIKARLMNSTCETPCRCATPVASMIEPLPFSKVKPQRAYLCPNGPYGLLNGTQILGLYV